MSGIDFLTFGTPEGKRHKEPVVSDAMRRLRLQMAKVDKRRISIITAKTRAELKSFSIVKPKNDNASPFISSIQNIDKIVLTNEAFAKMLLSLEEDELFPALIRDYLAEKWNPWKNAKLFSDTAVAQIIDLIRRGESPLHILNQYDPY